MAPKNLGLLPDFQDPNPKGAKRVRPGRLAKDRKRSERGGRVIARVAQKIGWDLEEVQVASTGTTYIRLLGPGCRLKVRVSGHYSKFFDSSRPNALQVYPTKHGRRRGFERLRDRLNEARFEAGVDPTLAPASEETKRANTPSQHVRAHRLTPDEQLAEVVASWPKLNAVERKRLLIDLRSCPSICGKPHESKLPAIGEVPTLIARKDVAEALGLKLATLDAWRRRGWITGVVRLSNGTFYTPEAVESAKRAAVARAKETP